MKTHIDAFVSGVRDFVHVRLSSSTSIFFKCEFFVALVLIFTDDDTWICVFQVDCDPYNSFHVIQMPRNIIMPHIPK